MNKRALILLALLVASHSAHADATKIVGWSGGAAVVKSYGPGGGLPLGRIEADGSLVLEMPEPPASKQTVDQTFANCGGEGGIAAGPLDVGFTPTSLAVERDGKELGVLHAATSPEVVAWRDSFGEKNAAQGAWLQWVHVTADSDATGECKITTYTDSAASDSFEYASEHKVVFTKGWNLMRNSILAVHTDSAGKRHAQHVVTDVVKEMPEGASWYFVK
jgi:hypothetical protein